jgi:hypothetical protein
LWAAEADCVTGYITLCPVAEQSAVCRAVAISVIKGRWCQILLPTTHDHESYTLEGVSRNA